MIPLRTKLVHLIARPKLSFQEQEQVDHTNV